MVRQMDMDASLLCHVNVQLPTLWTCLWFTARQLVRNGNFLLRAWPSLSHSTHTDTGYRTPVVSSLKLQEAIVPTGSGHHASC